MLNNSFSNWKKLRESTCIHQENVNVFAKVPQEKGDIVYFGIHDISRYYREHDKLPDLNLYDVFEKKGEIIEVDPVSEIVKISMNKTPFQYGYRRLENEKDKMRRYMIADDKIEITIPISNLQDISHLFEGNDVPVYLVIDGNNKYQKSLIKEIRKNEVKKSNQIKMPFTRHYEKYDGGEFAIEDDEEEKEEKEEMHIAHFDPSIMSNSRGWKIFTESKVYKYYSK